jgi:hypothetical protein
MSETTFLAKEGTYKKKEDLPNSSFAYVNPEGYTPASQKSFLEDVSSFKALSAEAISLQSDWTKFDQQRAKGGKGTKGTGTKTKTTKGKSTKGKVTKGKPTKGVKSKSTKSKTQKTKTKKTKAPVTKKTSFLEDSAAFFALVQEHKKDEVPVF